MADADSLRAGAIKLFLELLHRELGLQQSDFFEGAAPHIRGEWLRFNATSDTLSRGNEHYSQKLKYYIDQNPDILPTDPMWRNLYALATAQPKYPWATGYSPRELLLEGWQELERREMFLNEMAGSWLLFRLSSTAKDDKPLLNLSFLNIRPEAYYRRFPSAWKLFCIASSASENASGGDQQHYWYQGICRTYGTHLHFMASMDRPLSPVPLSMSLDYDYNTTRGKHRTQSEGFLSMVNSSGFPISAHVDAKFVSGSERWEDDEYVGQRQPILDRLGSRSAVEFEDIYDLSRYELLIQRSRESLSRFR